MPGARRARSLVCENKKHTSIVTTVTPETPGIPYAMVLTVSFALSLVSRACCQHHRQNAKSILGLLDVSVGASGPRDFAVRKIGTHLIDVKSLSLCEGAASEKGQTIGP